MIEVIEWPLGRGDEIMYRHPRDTLNWGDQCNVLPNQVAVFIKDSVVYDVLKSGRHFIKTKNIPFSDRISVFTITEIILMEPVTCIQVAEEHGAEIMEAR